MRLEIVDYLQHKITFTVPLQPVYQRFGASLTDDVPFGFDRTKIASITYAVDRELAGDELADYVKIKIGGLQITPPPIIPSELVQLKEDLITKGASYFKSGFGVDATTHLPYDNIEADGHALTPAKFTQPTIVGFYLQILGEVIKGKIDNGMTRDEALAEVAAVMTTLRTVQDNTSVSWKGLLPWLDLPSLGFGPMGQNIGLGDNANLTQSIAVLMGSIEGTDLTAAQQLVADSITAQVDEFISLQQEGYEAFVDMETVQDPITGLFWAAYDRETGKFSGHIDRLANEFRGAVAFLKVLYSGIPETVWTQLDPKFGDYKTAAGITVRNLVSFDGGAFQSFWPSLRNNELDFLGFRNAMNNALVSFSDYSAQNNLPGFTSASQRPNNNDVGGEYYGRQGVQALAEAGLSHADDFLIDVGSTYSLASAYYVNPGLVLAWLGAIAEQLPDLTGDYGFFDAARSNGEITKRYLAIDIASTVIGLADGGPEAFQTYLKNRGLELDYALLYDKASRKLAKEIKKTNASFASPPEFADRNFAVFNHFSSEGTLSNLAFNGGTTFTGTRFQYDGALNDGYGGRYWVLNQNYDARANRLVIDYSAFDSPQYIKVELKDENEQLLYSVNVPILEGQQGRELKKAVVQLPNIEKLGNVKKVFVVVDQNATGDLSANFRIQAIDFIHLPSSQDLFPTSGLNSNNVTTLPGSPAVQLIASNGSGNSIELQSSRSTKLNYSILNTGDYSGISIGFGASGADLSSTSSLVFGLASSKVKRLKLEIEDTSGNKAVYIVRDIDVAKRYYEFLTSRASSSLDLAHIKRLNFVADQSSIAPGDETGSLTLELGNLTLA